MKNGFFEVLSSIDCSKLTQKRQGLDYMPWAVVWKLLKQNYPESSYKVIKNPEGLNYHHDGKTGWVEVEVTLCVRDEWGSTHDYSNTEMLAIMDYAKHSIPLEKIRSTDVINTIQRCLVKSCARFGLGINVYGALDFDDLPGEVPETVNQSTAAVKETVKGVDLTEIRKRLDEAIKGKTAGMQRDDKVQFVEEVVTPALNGERNWKICSDREMLEKLLTMVTEYKGRENP